MTALNEQMRPEMNTLAYTIKNFCSSHGIGKTSAYKEIKEGRLEAKKAGGRTLITADSAAKWRKNLPVLTTADKVSTSDLEQ